MRPRDAERCRPAALPCDVAAPPSASLDGSGLQVPERLGREDGCETVRSLGITL
jgi:hypothetical protein